MCQTVPGSVSSRRFGAGSVAARAGGAHARGWCPRWSPMVTLAGLWGELGSARQSTPLRIFAVKRALFYYLRGCRMCVDWVKVAAIATCAGVVVNAGVVIVALLPIHRAKQERASRGLLTAAYLCDPLNIAYELMCSARSDLDEYVRDAHPDRSELETSVNRLRAVPARARGLLEKFDIGDAAYLPDGKGPQLAKAIGAANCALSVLEASIGRFDAVKRSFEARSGLPGSANHALVEMYLTAKREVISEAHVLPALFQYAIDPLGKFVDYCEDLVSHRE